MNVSQSDKTITDYVARYQMSEFLNDYLLNELKLFHFPIYSHIYVEQAEQHFLYFLVEGQVQCSHYHLNGKLAVISFSNPFEVVGEIEVFDEEYLRSNVIATQPTIMLGIEREIVRQYGADDTKFLHFLITQLKSKLYRINELQMNQVLPLISRLSLYILSQLLDDRNAVVLPAKEELASLLGTTSRHLNRVLKQLVESEIITAGYPRFHVIDKNKLESIAKQ